MTRRVAGPRRAIDPASEIEALRSHWSRHLPSLDTASVPIAVALRRSMQAAEQARRTLLDTYGLTPGSFDVLIAIHRLQAEAQCTPSLLSQILVLTDGRISQRLEHLEQRGLIRRRPAQVDKRQVDVRLTTPGRQLVEALMVQYLRHEDAMLTGLSSEERARLATLLLQLHQSIVSSER